MVTSIKALCSVIGTQAGSKKFMFNLKKGNTLKYCLRHLLFLCDD